MARPTILIGPPVTEMTKQAAIEGLKQNPKFPRDGEAEITQHAGHWIAAFVEKTAAPFGGPSDDSEGSPGPKSEGDSGSEPSGDSSPDDGGGPPDDGGGEEGGPPKHEKGGLDAIVHQLAQTVDAIAQALGVPPVGGPPGGLGPDGLDAGLGGGPPGGPPGLGGPPGAGGPPPPHGGPPGAGGPPPPQHMLHEKSGPPAPATFANVAKAADQALHPWGHMVGQAPFFVVAEEIGDDSFESVEKELQSLAKQGGFRIARFTPLVGQQGERAVQAVIEAPSTNGNSAH